MANHYCMKDPQGNLMPDTMGINPAHCLYLSGCFLAAFRNKSAKPGHGIRFLLQARRKGYRVVPLKITEVITEAT